MSALAAAAVLSGSLQGRPAGGAAAAGSAALALLGVTRADDAGLRALAAAPGGALAVIRGAGRRAGGLAALAAPAALAVTAADRLALAQQAAAALDAFAPVAGGLARPEALGRWLEAEAGTLTAALARVAGCEEWVATLRCAPPAGPAPLGATGVPDAPVAALRAPAGTPPTLAPANSAPASRPLGAGQAAPGPGGAGWLRARAAALRAEAAEVAAAESALAPLARNLSDLARATVVRGFRGAGGVGADLAVLLPRGAGAALRARLHAAPLRLSLSGPWPAYSFCGRAT